MRSQHLPITWEEFELMPWKLGWKYEYWGGEAHLTPRQQFAVTRVAVQPRAVHSSCLLRPVTPDDAAQLIALFFAAFHDTIEFCDWEKKKITAIAKKNIRNFFAGKRGSPLPASRLAVVPEAPETIVGAALLIEHETGPFLDMLFVAPEWHRHGLATALASEAINTLHAAGVEALRSCYFVGNEESMSWHKKFGFVEELDLMLAQMHQHYARHELWRRVQLGNLTEGERSQLVAECERWSAQVEALEEIADELGIEAVMPTMQIY